MSRFGWRSVLVVGALLLAVRELWLHTVPADVAYSAVGVIGAVATVVGVRRHRPRAAAAWWCLAAGQLLWAVGDGMFSWFEDVAHTSPFPSVADVLYLVAYPVLGAGLLLLVRARRRGVDRAGLVDAAIATTGLGLVSWVVLAQPLLADTTASLLARAVGAAYPAGDILLLAVTARLLTGGGATGTAYRLLVAGFGVTMVADTLYALPATAAWGSNGVLDPLWLAAYAAWGAAALHPSMRAMSQPAFAGEVSVSRTRVVVLALAALLAPATLAVELATGGVRDGWAVVVATVAISGLVVVRMSALLRDVTSSAAVAHRAAHDSLTGLANRARTLEAVEAALHRAQRSGGMVGLLFVDLDHFKAVNDAHGHAAGDDVLRATATRMQRLVRAGDVVGRLGGDEFVVLVEQLGSETEVVDLGGRLLAAVTAPVAVDAGRVVVGASVGVAVGRDGATDADALLHEADTAAYRAKSAGRARVEVFDEALRAELAEQADVEGAVRAGLAAGEFALHYQPVVDVLSGTVHGYEALIRWHRPGHGLVPPDAFIPVAERSSLICDIGRWVLAEATRQLAAWTREHPDDPVTVAVNLSGRHVADPGVVADVTGALEAAGVPAHLLVVEITETVLLDGLRVGGTLQALRDLGVGVSIDDFGTGYTSIGQLQHLPADVLKVDRSIVESAAPGAAELVALVVHAAHAFGLRVVAEGVERPEQLQALSEAGCDDAQGYLISRPAPAAEVRPAGVVRRAAEPPSR